MADDTAVDFERASAKHRHRREQEQKQSRVDAIKARFSSALPDKPRPVKDFLNKKRAKKKR